MTNPTEQEFYEQAQYDRVVAQNRSLQEENRKLKNLLSEIRSLLNAAEKSKQGEIFFDNFYKAFKKVNEDLEVNHAR